jgi:hypothetical protein
MQTYDAFAARVVSARGAGIPEDDAPIEGANGSDLEPSTSDSNVFATLAETYDAYVSLHRSGLWADVDPSWHPTLRCFYLRCEPESTPRRLGERRRGADPEERGRAEETQAAIPRTRTVVVPVASSRGGLSHFQLRALAGLGEAWRLELGTSSNETDETTDQNQTRADENQSRAEQNQTRPEEAVYGFVGDPAPAVATSLCVVDSDGTAVVVRIAAGLIEPDHGEEIEAEMETTKRGCLSVEAVETSPRFDRPEPELKPGPEPEPDHVGFSSGEEDLDERDIGEVFAVR